MSTAPPIGALSAGGSRLHLQHGPIDLVVGADGDPAAVNAAHRAAADRFATVLDELVAELDALRRPVADVGAVSGRIARRMVAAVAPFGDRFVTPMAAVAGSVAAEVLESMVAAAPLERAFVNNGGDIALHLAPGQELRVAVVGSVSTGAVAGRLVVDAGAGVRGVATSGLGGRSQTLGIADAVTALAADAPAADAAATLVANEVDLPGHPAVRRRPAVELRADSDLGAIPVCVGVGALTKGEVVSALARGRAAAARMVDGGRALGVILCLAGTGMSAGVTGFAPGSTFDMIEAPDG